MSGFSCILIGGKNLTIECGNRLLAAGYRIASVVAGHEDVADWARQSGLDVFQSVGDLRETEERVDFIFSIANLEMVPSDVLGLARQGGINFHDGPLPDYAGLNVPVWAILAGEKTHGITWHIMEDGADRGDIVVQRDFDIAEDETALSLNAKCFAAGVESFDDVLSEIAAGFPNRRAQDFSDRQYFERDRKPAHMGRLDFRAGAVEVVRLVRALNHGDYDNPVASAWFQQARQAVLVATAEEIDGEGAPGQVLAVRSDSVDVAVAGGAVRLSGLRDSFGNTVDAKEVLQVSDDLASSGVGDLNGAAIAKAAAGERAWRRVFVDYRPADWPMLPDTTGGSVRVAVETHGQSPSDVDAAFACLICAMSGGEPMDMAIGCDTAGGVLNGWKPVRFYPAGGRRQAMDRFANEQNALDGMPAFAFDLPARISGVSQRFAPKAGIGRSGPVDAAALTLVHDGEAPVLVGDGGQICAAEVELMAARLSHLLGQLEDLPGNLNIADLPVLPVEERGLVLDGFNQTQADTAAIGCIHTAFEAQVEKTPVQEALAFENQSVSYAELNARANQLAHVLIDEGVTPGDPVGLHLTRSVDMVVSAMAILKAGGAYVPLDPGYPADRIAFYAHDCGARIIVSESALAGGVQPDGAKRIEVDHDERISQAAQTNPKVEVGPDDLAYLIYTSGSTGTPKGVMIEHRNVANFFVGMDDRIDYADGSVWLSVTSLSFDISVLELFWTLARGFKVVLLGDEKLVSDGTARRASIEGGMDFSLYYWGNDDGVGRDKYALLMEGAKFADAHGFQAVWTPERHFHAFGGLYPNPSVTGAAVAAITKNIAVRAGSVVAPLHHPARIAEEWAVIDNLTNGRTGLALASGWHPDDFVLRPENSPPNNKQAMLDAIADLRRLWAGEALEMTRADGSVVEKVTQPRPVSKDLEMWLTIAGNPESWRQAGEAGVNVLTHLLGQSIEELAEKIEIYHQALRGAGHDPKDFKVTLMLHTYLAETREQSMEIARAPMKDYLRAAADLIKQYAWAFPAFKKPKGVETPRDLDLGTLSEDELDDVLEFAFLRYFETSGLFGTVDDAIARVAELKKLGVTEVACLIDYGIDRQVILDGLTLLSDVRRIVNDVSGEEDFSIAGQIARHGVTHLQCTPFMARMLVEDAESRAALGELDCMMVGGEAFPPALADDLRGATKATVLNMYGPTETTIWSTTEQVDAGAEAMSVGRPIANTQCYVLNDAMEPVAIGQTGQLWIGGAGVARGYWAREDLTEDKFRVNPFQDGRMFATGDLARWRSDGRLDVLGRADNQIKVRGYRVEIGEIEAAIEAVSDVTQAVVLVREDASGVGQIVGFVAGAASEADIRRQVAEKLPAFMVPARIVKVDQFPLTPNKKIDRKALLAEPKDPVAVPVPKLAPEPAAQGATARRVEAEDVAEIWRRALNVGAISASDNFFDLGGHSLLAIEVHRKIKSELGVTGLSIADIFRAPTLGGLTAVIEKLQGTSAEISPVSEVKPRSVTARAPAEAAARPVTDQSVVSRRKELRAARKPV